MKKNIEYQTWVIVFGLDSFDNHNPSSLYLTSAIASAMIFSVSSSFISILSTLAA